MALDTFLNLRAAVRNQSHRNDLTDDQIDDFIDTAEGEIYANPLHPLRIRQLETRATASTTTTEKFIQLPDDFLQQRRFKIVRAADNLPDFELVYKTPEQLPFSSIAGIPRFFTVTSQIEFERIPDDVYTLEAQYYKKAAPLTEANPTNEVLTDYPSIYLFGTLWALFQWTQQIDQAEYYSGKFMQAISGANEESRKGRYGPAPAMRIEGPTP